MARTFGPFRITRELRRRVPGASGRPGAFTTVPDGKELVTVELDIDVERLARQLGQRAGRNLGTNRSSLAAGAIVCRVTFREREGGDQ